MPAYDQLYVVSDLHIGGRKDQQQDMQIFRSGTLLGGLISTLAGPQTEQEFRQKFPASSTAPAGTQVDAAPDAAAYVGLVINGDFVDFLAETPASYLDTGTAVGKLSSIVEREQFRPVFFALRRFLRQPNRELVVVLGNHDLSLALPHVQEWLADYLAEGDAAARGRLRFATDGAGFRCSVSGANVLCLHGEIADDWNLVDHQGLRRIAHLYNRGQVDFPWEPSGGTQLVVDIMNDIKKTRPFIDLLKPEQDVMLPVLFALDESVRGKIARLLKPWMKKCTSAAWRERFLGADGEVDVAEAVKGDPLTRAALEFTAATASDGSLLADVEQDMQKGVDPVTMVTSTEEGEQMLSMGRVLLAITKGKLSKLLSSKSPIEILRQTLREILAGDRTFELDEPDEPFNWVEKNVSSSIHFVVAGHTHLARQIPWGGGMYFNSGTWAALMRLTDQQLEKEETFKPVYDRLLAAKTMADLFGQQPLAEVKPTVVAIRANAGAVTGQLCLALQTADGVRLGAWSK